MAFSRVFPLLVLSVISCYASEVHVPVYMWGDLPVTRTSLEELSFDALSTVSIHDFQHIVKKELVSNRMLVIFIENAVSVEDFSSKNEYGKSVFPYLHKELKKAVYLPSVKNPVHALKRIAHDDAVHVKLTEDGLSNEISPETDIVFIHLEDAEDGESRTEMLARHDQFMKETIDELQKSRKCVAIYTGHQPSWIPVTLSRSRRAAPALTTPRVYALDGLRLFTKGISLTNNNKTVHLNGMTGSKTEFNNTIMNTTLTFENQTLVLNFREDVGYWYWDSVVLNQADLIEYLYPVEEMFAPKGFSYRCQQYVTFSSINDTKPYTLAFEDLKIQPYFEPTNSSTTFGDSYNCVGFFSAPIWSALFVVFILLTITFYGIMMMLDIRTMDRFDDPKGKTITINAVE